MKRTAAAAVCLAVFALAAQTAAFAQMSNRIRLTLPHATVVGTVTLPPGECTIESLRSDNTSTVLLIRSVHGQTATALAAPHSHAGRRHPTESAVVLRQTGDTFEIERVWFNASQGFDLLDRAERP